tara:strand:- start:209 stop:397 length:189 start_codon:yes stop_codon:yes gene_type:complete
MSKSYKFKGEVNRSHSRKKKKVNLKERTDKPSKKKERLEDEPLDYLDWEEEGDFEKFDKKRW